MPPKAPAAKAPDPQVEPLNDEELQFVWRCLVEEGKLTLPKLRQFMEDITGEKLSVVQAKDLLNYMDMNGDGRVGQEDFKAFMQTSCLGMTDPKTFMWTPKSKFRQESGLQPGGAGVDEGDGGTFALTQSSRQQSGAGSSSQPPPPKAPLADPGKQHDKNLLAKIDRTLDRYEQETWERLLKEEENCLKQMFSQFSEGENGDELDAKGFHKMTSQWYPISQWCAAGSLRPADSLATMRHINSRGEAQTDKGGDEGDGGEATAASHHDEAATTVPFHLWQELVFGKFGEVKKG